MEEISESEELDKKTNLTNLETSFKKCTIECYPKIRLTPQLRQDLYTKFLSILDSYDKPRKSIEKFESWLKEKNLKPKQLFSMLSAECPTEKTNTTLPQIAAILGFMYEHGIGTERNLLLAFKYYKMWYDAVILSPSHAHNHTHNFMGIFYRDGIGVDRDPGMAYELFRQGAALQHPAAQYHLSLCYRDGIGTTVDSLSHFYWCNKSAVSGYTPAQLQIANFHRNNTSDVNHKKLAFTWYSKAKDQDTEAMFQFGMCHKIGFGTPLDLKTAYVWFLIAASGGSKEAALQLADAYQGGQGIKRNEASALRWYNVAAKNGSLVALYKLGQAYHQGNGVKRSRDKAFRYFVQYLKRAECEEDDVSDIGVSQYVLGNCYHYGWGVTKDLHMASKWYRKAIDNGNKSARIQLLFVFTKRK
ncbi:4959_t:CDS:1 [Ambispora gerdemannii]|uniref:4959_t:CDS:1 n=1 Tax=Ambispora gerdemannii TaxID=144530 RepID=A0A9N9EZL1_9GLOM|nr:4959_t:CDS:1 [Ambispora gerdemannii]